MAKVSFEISDEDRALMKAHPEINWSEALRRAIRRQVRAQEIAAALLEEDDDPRVQAVARGLGRGMAERFARLS